MRTGLVGQPFWAEYRCCRAVMDKHQAPIVSQTGSTFHHGNSRNTIVLSIIDHCRRYPRNAACRTCPDVSLGIHHQTADAVVGKSGDTLRFFRVGIKQSVLRSHPQVSLCVAQHAVVLVGVFADDFCRFESCQRVGFGVKHTGTVLRIEHHPRFSQRTGSYYVSIAI